jgi:hypothetical protein
MENGVRTLIFVLTLVALAFSLAIPFYCIPTGLVALFRPLQRGAVLLGSSPQTAIFTRGIGPHPAAAAYVNRNVDPRLTEPYNTMIYKQINRRKD